MFRILFLLFLAVPIIEIYTLIKVGGIIGAPLTIFLVVFTAVLGALLLRIQGLYTLQKARSALERGELPTVAMFEGVILLVSGALLLTPGFFTDTIGFLGLVPPVRRGLIRAVLERGIVHATHSPPAGHGPRTIEGEFRREEDGRD